MQTPLSIKIHQLLMEDFSGGIKFLTLFTYLNTELLARRHDANISHVSADDVLNAAQTDERIGILEYIWPMGGTVGRTKYFIYLA